MSVDEWVRFPGCCSLASAWLPRACKRMSFLDIFTSMSYILLPLMRSHPIIFRLSVTRSMKPIDTFTEDAKLVQQIKAGDPAAETRLFEKYFERIFFFVSRKVKPRQVHEDITITTLSAVISAAKEDRIKNPRALSLFVYRIALEKIDSYVQGVHRGKGRVFGENTDESEVKNARQADPDASSPAVQAEEVRLLKQACKNLDDQERQIVFLYYCRQWRYREIAEFLSFSYPEPKTAEQVRQTAKRLREKLQQHFREDFQ